MLSRHDISDDHWNRIAHLLPGQAGGHGGVGNDTRLFVNAIRYLAKTGIAWADVPTCFGKPNSLWQRYNRWCATGVWARVAAQLRDDDTEWLSADSSCVRASVAATCFGASFVFDLVAASSFRLDLTVYLHTFPGTFPHPGAGHRVRELEPEAPAKSWGIRTQPHPRRVRSKLVAGFDAVPTSGRRPMPEATDTDGRRNEDHD